MVQSKIETFTAMLAEQPENAMIRTLPSLPLVADCGRIKLTLVTVKVTFGTPIPSVSLTRPIIAPVVAVCARELVAKRNVKRERLAVEMKYIETLIRNRLISA